MTIPSRWGGPPTAWTRATLIALVAAAACSKRSEPPDEKTASAASTEAHAATAAGSPAGSACVMAELWSQCQLRKRLENAGLAPRDVDSVHYEFLHASGRKWMLGKAQLQTFIYPSAERLRVDLAAFDTSTAQPRNGSHIDWGAPPTVIVSRNLLAVFAGLNERQTERVSNVLSAGLPVLTPK